MTTTARRPVLAATLALLAVTAVWGGTFPVVKDAIPPLGRMPVLDFLAWRFAIATAAMAVLRPRAVARLGTAGRRRGVLLGLALGIGYITQTLGLAQTPAAVSGFVTGMFVVFTPLVSALLLHKPVGRSAWLGVVLATLGLALLSVGSTGGSAHATAAGLLLTLGCAVAFAIHIVGLGEWSHQHDTMGLAVVQLGTVTVLCAVTGLLAGLPGGAGLRPPPDASTWWAILLTAVAATAVAFLVQTWAQALLDATRAAVIMTMEPVFAGVFAVTFAGETMGVRAVAGAALVLAAMLFVEVGPRHGAEGDVRRLEV